MKRQFLLLMLFVGMMPASAQSSTSNRVAWNDFAMTIDASFAANVEIRQVPGDPLQPDPGFADAPHAEFTLLSPPAQPTESGQLVAMVRAYKVADLAPYHPLAMTADALIDLTVERPDMRLFAHISDGKMADVLPYAPVTVHPQVLRAKMHYLDGAGFNGVAYLFYSAAAREPFMSNGFIYTFQGISADGKTYVSAWMPVTTTALPDTSASDPAAFEKAWPDYLKQSMDKLDAAAASEFQPSLETFDALAQTFTVSASTP